MKRDAQHLLKDKYESQVFSNASNSVKDQFADLSAEEILTKMKHMDMQANCHCTEVASRNAKENPNKKQYFEKHHIRKTDMTYKQLEQQVEQRHKFKDPVIQYFAEKKKIVRKKQQDDAAASLQQKEQKMQKLRHALAENEAKITIGSEEFVFHPLFM